MVIFLLRLSNTSKNVLILALIKQNTVDYNRLFNDIFFLILDEREDENMYPVWESFSIIHNPIQQLIKAQDY